MKIDFKGPDVSTQKKQNDAINYRLRRAKTFLKLKWFLIGWTVSILMLCGLAEVFKYVEH
jgi:hypothetical protein